MKRDAIIPSMFHRRLLLLLVMVVLAVFALVGQLYRLTVVQGAEHLEAAEAILVDSELLPTYRGRLVDRRGQALALDRPCFDILVDYRLISGEWAVAQAGREARRLHREEWNELSRARREALIEQYRPRYEREVEEVWREIARLGGAPLEEVYARRDAIAQRVERMADYIHEQWRQQRERQFQTQIPISEVRRPILEQRRPHVILTRIAAGEEAQFKALSANGPQIGRDQPAVTVRTSGTRDYPWRRAEVTLDRSTLPAPLRRDEPLTIEVSNVTSHLVGSMREEVNREELEARPLYGEGKKVIDLKGYLPGDGVGGRGLERALEEPLRGTRGVITRYVDDTPDERLEPQPGGVVPLTIDVQLQAKVLGLLDPRLGLTVVQPWHGQENELPLGTPLAAGAVIIEVRSGEVLACVSSPTELPEPLARYRAALGEKEREEFDRLVPPPDLFHRALDIPYAPGSIIKPLFMSWAMSHGQWGLQREVECRGHFYPDNNQMLRCWIYRPPAYGAHGPLGPVEAIARSCNIYFYTIGHHLGLERCREVYADWGLGRPLDLGVSLYNRPVGYDPSNPPGRSEPLMLAMGQGSVAWTPLHAAAAYAALARGGYYLAPTFIRDDPRGAPRIADDLELDDQAVFLALKGLHEVVNNQQYGGARHIDVGAGEHRYEPIFNAEGVNVWGKTGTAQQAWPTRIMRYGPDAQPLLDAAGRPTFIERSAGIGSHSWFVGLVGPGSGDGRGRPEYAIAVIVEWGGSGSRCAGPIANQIIHLLKSEGYLP